MAQLYHSLPVGLIVVTVGVVDIDHVVHQVVGVGVVYSVKAKSIEVVLKQY